MKSGIPFQTVSSSQIWPVTAHPQSFLEKGMFHRQEDSADVIMSELSSGKHTETNSLNMANEPALARNNSGCP